MGLKEFNAKKELKKLKRRNKKIKKLGVYGVLIGTIFLLSSYALYSYTGSSLAFSGKVSKRIHITINTENGKIGSSTSKTVETDYGKTITETVTPDDGYIYGSVSCDNSQTASYNNNTLTITPTKDTTCTITFKETLRHKILADNTVKEDQPDFTKGFPNKDTTEEDKKNKSGLYKTEDDQEGSYYFRGDIKNNYVKFGKGQTSTAPQGAGKDLIWRIVRINGDGTIRLILESSIGQSKFSEDNISQHEKVGFTYSNTTPCTHDHPCEVTYKDGIFTNTFGGHNSDIKTKLEEWYSENLKEEDSKIASSYFCNDTSYGINSTDAVNNYNAYERILVKNQPSLQCPDPKDSSNKIRTYGGIYNTKIGLINADELAFAGLKPGNTTDNQASSNNYLYHSSMWWSMSPSHSFSEAAYEYTSIQGRFYYGNPTHTQNDIYPVINLRADTQVIGEGTSSSPFVVQ